MAKRLLGYDFLTGLKTYHEYDHPTKQTTISYEHDDVGPVVKWAQDLASGGLENLTHARRQDQSRHVATIPESIILKWRTEGIDIFNDEHWPMVRKKLNDPDNKFFRTWKGQV